MENAIVELFESIGEPFGAGLFEAPEKSYFYRYCCAYARWFEAHPLAEYKPGEMLYPCGNRHRYTSAINRQYACTYEEK